MSSRGRIVAARVCRICTKLDHLTDCCPMLEEDVSAQVNSVENFSRPPQRLYNPHANTYNSGWKDQPNFNYEPNPRMNHAYQPPAPQQYQPQKSSLELIIEHLAISQENFQLKTEAHFQ